MKNNVLKASYLKHLKICTKSKSDKQYISVLPVRIHGQVNHSIVDKHPSVQNREMFSLTFLVFSTYDTHYFHEVVFPIINSA